MSKPPPAARSKPPPLPPTTFTRLNQRDLDSSCYRLSRVRGQFAVSKAVKSEPSESFAITYFSQNPIDTRPPQQKLDDIESKLSDSNLDRNARFSLIVQKRTLCQLLHGETSPEFVRATTELGHFYNSENKSDSACRNLSKATQYAQQVELTEEDEFALVVELADANLNASAPSKLEKAKQVALADIQLTPYSEYQSPNKMSCFRRDLCLARIRSFRTKWEDALALYELALAVRRDGSAARENRGGRAGRGGESPGRGKCLCGGGAGRGKNSGV